VPEPTSPPVAFIADAPAVALPVAPKDYVRSRFRESAKKRPPGWTPKVRDPGKHPLEEKYFIKARGNLGLSRLEMSVQKFRAIRDLGHWLDRPLAGNIMKCDLMTYTAALERAMKYSEEIMKNEEPGKYSAEQKIAAGVLMNTTAKTFRDLSMHLMDLIDKTEQGKGPVKKKLNLPPQANMQVNIHTPAGSAPIEVTATTGNGEPDEAA